MSALSALINPPKVQPPAGRVVLLVNLAVDPVVSEQRIRAALVKHEKWLVAQAARIRAAKARGK